MSKAGGSGTPSKPGAKPPASAAIKAFAKATPLGALAGKIKDAKVAGDIKSMKKQLAAEGFGAGQRGAPAAPPKPSFVKASPSVARPASSPMMGAKLPAAPGKPKITVARPAAQLSAKAAAPRIGAPPPRPAAAPAPPAPGSPRRPAPARPKL